MYQKTKGRRIFISNYEDVSDSALRSRMLFVRALVPFWEGVEVPTLLPTEEDVPSVSIAQVPTMAEDTSEESTDEL